MSFIWHNVIGWLFIVPQSILAELNFLVGLLIFKLFSQNKLVLWKQNQVKKMLSKS